MQNISSRTSFPTSSPSVSLSLMYRVLSGPTYHVTRVPGNTGTLEIFRTMSGRGGLTFEDGSYVEVGGDSLIICSFDDLVRYRSLDSSWVFWWFRFTADGPLGLPLREALSIEGALSDDVHASQCFTLLQEDTPEASALASATLSMLLSKWSWRLNHSSTRNGPHHEAVANVIAMMHKRLGDGLSVSAMAKAACLGERRFRQVFEQITGLTPKKYYDRLRIEMGAEMLSTTPYSLAELADQLGYSSAFHFSKAFKAYFGVPPREYRGR